MQPSCNPTQRLLLASAVQKRPKDASLVIATNHDQGGRDLAEEIKGIALMAQPALNILEQRPEKAGTDWNEQLKAEGGQPLLTALVSFLPRG